MRYTAIDLFSGCGGLTRGLKDAGYRVLAAVEIDRKACETYRANHQNVALLSEDIRQVSAAKLLRSSGLKRANLICWLVARHVRGSPLFGLEMDRLRRPILGMILSMSSLD